MSFAQPVLLYALLTLPLLALALFVRYRHLLPLVRSMSLQKDRVITNRYFYSGLFGFLAFAALVTAAAGPSLMLKYQEERPHGMDIVFAFDVSRSMNVSDVVYDGETMTRLEAAKAVAGGLLTTLESYDYRNADYRYAVAVGKGEGILAIPLTYGVETVRAMLDSLSSSSISAAGTNVEKLTTAAATAFPPALSASYPSEKRIILFTDGEALSGEFRHAVESAKEREITVTAVCVGSEQGGTIPVGTSSAGLTLFLRDKTGKPIVSKAEYAALQEAVEKSGGFFIQADNREAAITALNVELSPSDGDEMREVRKKKDICFLFASLALVFFALHKCAFYSFPSRLTTNKRRPSA